MRFQKKHEVPTDFQGINAYGQIIIIKKKLLQIFFSMKCFCISKVLSFHNLVTPKKTKQNYIAIHFLN